MFQEKLRQLLAEKKNFVLLGEAGSGKTELALSLSEHMARLTNCQIHLLDMDQTKPNFRARNASATLAHKGVTVHFHEQFLDTPNLIPGVTDLLRRKGNYVLMDVGGGNQGAHMIGQFHQLLNGEDAAVLYVFNPYRPWSDRPENIRETMRRVLGAARLHWIHLVANPNLGPDTTLDQVLEGLKRTRALLEGTSIDFACVLEQHCEALQKQISEPVIPVRLHTLPRWLLLSQQANSKSKVIIP